MHWVSDLLVECDVEVASAKGALLLDLVKGGKHFTCTIELETGAADDAAQASALLEELADKLLANTVIEDFAVRLQTE